MTWAERDFLSLSALQHYQFCPRQCALIHLEQTWAENRLTAEGRVLHETADGGRTERRGDLVIARSVPLKSAVLGLSGIADVVEFRKGLPPLPVEYKRGRPKTGREDEVQLCAQAICLEEMLDVAVPEGALFYGAQKKRRPVVFDDGLRALTTSIAAEVHDMMAGLKTPGAERRKGCDSCSIIRMCFPDKQTADIRRYMRTLIEDQ